MITRYLFSLVLALSLVGCGSLNSTAYKTTAITVAAVNSAEDYWGVRYRAGLATTGEVDKVHKAVDAYNAAMTVYKDAIVASYASTTNSTSAVQQAETGVIAARFDLFNLILVFLPADQQAQLTSLLK